MLFYCHEAEGLRHANALQQPVSPLTPEFGTQPLLDAKVALFQAPARWTWQEMDMAKGGGLQIFGKNLRRHHRTLIKPWDGDGNGASNSENANCQAMPSTLSPTRLKKRRTSSFALTY